MKKIFIGIFCFMIVVISCGCNKDDSDLNLEALNDNEQKEKTDSDAESNENIVSLCNSVSKISDDFDELKITKDEVIDSMIQLKDTCLDSSNICSVLKSFGTTITTNTDESRVKVFVEEVEYQCAKVLK